MLKKIKERNGRFLKSAVCKAVFCVLGAFVMTSCGNTRVNLEDYTDVEFYGGDGYGKAKLNFDRSELVNLLTYDPNSDTVSITTEIALDDLDVEVSPKEGLKNGDIVTVTYTYPESLEKLFKVKLSPKSGGSFTKTVEGLEKVGTIDLFEDIESQITFSDTAPFTSLQVANNDKFPNISYIPDKSVNISNGDEITVTVKGRGGSGDFTQFCVENFNAVPEKTEYKFTVSGLDSYLVKLDDFSAENLDILKSKAQEIINSAYASSEKTINSSEYLGSCLQVGKTDGVYTSSHNKLSLIYKFNETNKDGAFDVYYYVMFKDVIILADGTLDVNYDLNTETAAKSWIKDEYFETGNDYCVGYKTLDQLLNDKFIEEEQYYNYETDLN